MAHFAELSTDNIVLRVVVINNDDTIDANGNESEPIGIAFCQSLFGENTRWVQTSYNGNIRKHYAGIGYLFDAQRDAFIPPQPYPSWTLDEETCDWEPPVPYPNDGNIYTWDEDSLQWSLVP